MNGSVLQLATLLNPQRVPDAGWKIVAIGDSMATRTPISCGRAIPRHHLLADERPHDAGGRHVHPKIFSLD
jgi:hypothetical protein